jgi:hypothetical protein
MAILSWSLRLEPGAGGNSRKLKVDSCGGVVPDSVLALTVHVLVLARGDIPEASLRGAVREAFADDASMGVVDKSSPSDTCCCFRYACGTDGRWSE